MVLLTLKDPWSILRVLPQIQRLFHYVNSNTLSNHSLKISDNENFTYNIKRLIQNKKRG